MPSYSLSIVTFFDILGFKDIVVNKDPVYITNILNFLSYVTGYDANPDNDYSPRVLSFSDSIIRTVDIESETNKEYRIGLLFHEILSVLSAQMELVNRGILIRGAITIGKVASSPNGVFGPAFIEAYELESKIAQSPRIVVSSNALRMIDESDLLIEQHHSRQEEKEYIKDLLRLDSDGVWFIDYLYGSESEIDDPRNYYLFLRNHRNLITKVLRLNKLPVSDIHKYTWLAQYHNNRINELPDRWFKQYKTTKDKLLVSPTKYKSLYEF